MIQRSALRARAIFGLVTLVLRAGWVRDACAAGAVFLDQRNRGVGVFGDVVICGDVFWFARMGGGLKRYAKNLNHLTLPEIKDFNALGDESCLKANAKCFRTPFPSS